MSAVENYILDQDEFFKILLMNLHDLIMENPEVTCALKWGLPVYDAHKYFGYIHPKRKENCVELCFVQGNHFDDPSGLLEGRKRKLVKGVYIDKLTDELISELKIIIRNAIDYNLSLKKAK